MKNPLTKKGALESFLDEPTGEEKQSRKPSDEVRATFIVDSHKLQLLKDLAYIERRQIKDVFDDMLSEYLSKHFDNSKAINGNTWDE